MHFAFTDEQQGLREVIRDVLTRHCTTAEVRAAQTDAEPAIARLATAMQKIGVTEIAVPAERGGLGLGMVEVCLALHELGYAGAPGDWVAMVALNPQSSHEAPADRGATGVAAYLDGLGRRMLDMAVAHACAREQFGTPIGSFQAVQHHLADARLASEFAIPLTWRAAWCLDHDPEHAAIAASMARAKSGDAALLIARKSLQCHGAMGYAHEYDLQLFMKRTWQLAAAYGDPASHRRRVAALLFAR